MTYDKTIAALADETRRSVLETLKAGPLPVGELAQRLPVSRPAVSQHLRVLSDAGLLTVRTVGTRRLYAIDPCGAESLRRYLDSMWDDALAAFTQMAEEKAAAKDRK